MVLAPPERDAEGNTTGPPHGWRSQTCGKRPKAGESVLLPNTLGARLTDATPPSTSPGTRSLVGNNQLPHKRDLVRSPQAVTHIGCSKIAGDGASLSSGPLSGIVAVHRYDDWPQPVVPRWPRAPSDAASQERPLIHGAGVAGQPPERDDDGSVLSIRPGDSCPGCSWAGGTCRHCLRAEGGTVVYLVQGRVAVAADHPLNRARG